MYSCIRLLSRYDAFEISKSDINDHNNKSIIEYIW